MAASSSTANAAATAAALAGATSEAMQWRITVKTANTTVAGIVSTVFIRVHGKGGRSLPPIELGAKNKRVTKSQRAPFSRGVTSYFLLRREDVGEVDGIEVWHNAESSWHLEFIEIQKGQDSYMFRPDGPVVSERHKVRGETHVVLKGKHSLVASGANRFHMASRNGEVSELEGMLTRGEFKVDDEDKLGRTAAHYACLYGQPDALMLLIEWGARLGKKDLSGKTTLHHACLNHRHNLEIVKTLLRNCPEDIDALLNEVGGQDSNAAAAGGSDKLRRFVQDADRAGKRPMHMAATHGFIELIRYLDSQCPAAIRDVDNMGETPLVSAAIQGETKAAVGLIDLGAEFVRADKDQRTFLHHASTAGHADFIKYVLEFGFPKEVHDQLFSLLEAPDSHGRTPVIAAAADGGLETVRVLEDLGADLYKEDEDKNNALLVACRRGDAKLLGYLAQKFHLNGANVFGMTPLMVAVDANNAPAVRWLLGLNVDLTARSIAGETAYDMAKKRGDGALFRMLENAQALSRVQQDREAARRKRDGAYGADVDYEEDLKAAHDAEGGDKQPFFGPNPTGAGGGGAGGDDGSRVGRAGNISFEKPDTVSSELVHKFQQARIENRRLKKQLAQREQHLRAYYSKHGALSPEDAALADGPLPGEPRPIRVCQQQDCVVM